MMLRLAVLKLVVGKLANALCVVQKNRAFATYKKPSVNETSQSDIPTILDF